MKAKFIEGSPIPELGIVIQPETDEERLLLMVFAHQASAHLSKLWVQGWGMGGSAQTGLREIRIVIDKTEKPEPEQG